MENSNPKYFNNYYDRLKRCRRKYFFEKLSKLNWKKPYSIISLLRWLQKDLVFIIKWSLNVLLQIRRYGPTIRREYGRSYWRQWKGFMYVKFVLRCDPKHYRTRLLFKEKNSQLINDFALQHYPLQRKLAELSSKSELSILKNKFEFNQYCVSENIPTPEILAVIENGEVTFQLFDDFIPHTSVFIKNLSGGGGDGTNRIKYVNGTYRDRTNSYSSIQLKDKLKEISLSNGAIIAQPMLKNHNSWAKFTPGSLATCRIVTAKMPNDLNVVPLFCCFRMPVGDLVADNYSLGGIIAPVDLSTGKLGVAVASTPKKGKFEFTKHPDTCNQIDGAILPYWDDILKFTLDVHQHFKTLFIGWDVSLTTRGCSMIEGKVTWASCSYEIPFQDSLKNTAYPELFEKWMEKYE